MRAPVRLGRVRARSALFAVAVGLGAVIIAGGVAAEIAGGGPAARRAHPGIVRVTTTTSPGPNAGWRPVVPATTVPADTPVQQQYDKGFEAGFSSASNRAMMIAAEAVPLSPPAVGGGWPRLPEVDTPERWATEFVMSLLHIDFAHETRQSLGAWLVAEEAPDLMPGIPPRLQDRTLYISAMSPSITGQISPVPSSGQWRTLAAAGVRWTVGGLQAQLDPQWQQMVDAGWQPPDIRAAVEDVSGVMTVHGRGTVTTKRFSIVVQVGSARWDQGYGSVLVSGWKVL